jgi:hypothetical protein
MDKSLSVGSIVMKRFALVAAGLLLSFTGCGLSRCQMFNKGSQCVTSSCTNSAPVAYAPTAGAMADAGCNGCETVGVGYGDYTEGYTHSTLPGIQNAIPQESVNGQRIQ